MIQTIIFLMLMCLPAMAQQNVVPGDQSNNPQMNEELRRIQEQIGTLNIPTIPSQVGNSGKYLTTNGTAISWSSVTSIPSGVITMWAGSIGTIPSGWVICDGSNGTPDLRDRFIMAAGGSYAVGANGDGTIPSHSHTAPSIPFSGIFGDGSYLVSADGSPHGTTNINAFGSGSKVIATYYALAYIMKQ